MKTTRNILGQGLSEVKPVETKALATGDGSETIVEEAGNALKTATGDKGAHCSFYRLHKPGR